MTTTLKVPRILEKKHWCLAPIDIANFWKAGNRIRIIIGALGCTQVRISNSCSSKRKKDFGNLYFGFGIFCLEVQSAFWRKWPKKFGPFLAQMFPYTPFSRPTRDPGWEFSLGGDFFPPFKLWQKGGGDFSPPSKFHRRVGEISSPPCRYPPHSPFQILIFWKC